MHSSEQPLTAEDKQFFTELDSNSHSIRSIAKEISILLKNCGISDIDIIHMMAAADKVHTMNIEQLDVVMDEMKNAMHQFSQRPDVAIQIPSEINSALSLKMIALGEEANTLFEKLEELIKKYG